MQSNAIDPDACQLSLLDPSQIETDTSDSDSWCTPPEVFEPVLLFLGAKLFGLDPCTNEQSFLPARRIFTIAHDGLNQKWNARESIWLNPPYSKPKPWLVKLLRSKSRHKFALVKADHTTSWFQQRIWPATCVLFLNDRVRFMDPTGGKRTQPPWGCVLAYYGLEPKRFAREVGPVINKAGAEPVF